MVKREATQISSSRQQTLMFDRRRSRAVSVYLADHREILLKMLPDEMKTNKQTKRNELLALARKHFHKASESEQQTYYAKVRTVLASGEFRSLGQGEQLVESRSGGEGEQLVEFRSVGEGGQPSIGEAHASEAHVGEIHIGEAHAGEAHAGDEGEQLVEFRSVGEGGQPSIEQPIVEEQLVEFRGSVAFRSARDGKAGSPPRTPAGGVTSSALHAAVCHPTPRKAARRSFQSAAPWSMSESAGPSCGLRNSLTRANPHLRALYGDAGALETMACAIRILDVVDMKQWKNRRAVKLAVVVGMAAKLSATPSDEQHVRKLWAKFAGDSSEHEVRKLEKEVFMAWARS